MPEETVQPTEAFDFLLAVMPWTILLFAILVAMAIGVHVLGKWRDHGGNDREDRASVLTNFQEMYERGEVSEEEFREIKSQLAGKVPAKLNDSDDTG